MEEEDREVKDDNSPYETCLACTSLYYSQYSKIEEGNLKKSHS